MSRVKMEDNEEEDKEGEELDRTVVVNDSPTKSLSKADYADEENVDGHGDGDDDNSPSAWRVRP